MTDKQTIENEKVNILLRGYIEIRYAKIYQGNYYKYVTL